MFRSLCFACCALAMPALVRAAEPTAEDFAFFEKNVRPVLAGSCFDCHSEDYAESDLRLDSLRGMLAGGTRGPAIVPGKPDQSLLIRAIKHGELLQMPPENKLPVKAITDLAEWIRRGAPWPNAEPLPRPTTARADAGPIYTEEEKLFWAFQPPVDSPPPAVESADWVRQPIDAFILAKLETAGLKPAPPADKRTLLRRATFDLTGLPPTPAESEAFLADDSPQAFSRVIDRLLASPQYGERWGRHWLDVARYADSNGMDENLVFVNAFRYRDYVIDAFNRDLPYDRFVREQLAGDLLPRGEDESRAEHHRRLIATGFLSIGPKMLADDDPVKKQMDIIDEQIATTCRAFMALTMECARCHDHKFDPLRTADYYALAGIFKSTKTMENFAVVAKWHEYEIATAEDLARKAAHEKKIEAVAAKLRQATQAAGEAKKRLADLEKQKKELEASRPQMPRAMGVREGQVQNVKIHLRGSHLTLGREVPRQFPGVIAGEDQTPIGPEHSGRLQLARWLTRPEHPLTARVMVNRVWRWHFGAGIVATPDNFGQQGARPTHPALLDWLALDFVRSGWSIKQLHRRIMLSSTYQMSGAYDARAAELDAENKLHWRHARRRMEAEVIRDAILALGGELDLAMGGSLMNYQPRQYVRAADTRLGAYDFPRRSVYLPVYRSAVYPVFQAFDFADPSVFNGDRATTTVPSQALFMMNSKLVSDAAGRWAERLLARHETDDAHRVREAFVRAYARPPRADETARFTGFVQEAARAFEKHGAKPDAARQLAWRSACRVLLAANEFIYLE